MSKKPSKDPVWNRQYIEQRLKDRKFEQEVSKLRRLDPVDTDAAYWWVKYSEEQQRATELETRVRELELMLKLALRQTPRDVRISLEAHYD